MNCLKKLGKFIEAWRQRLLRMKEGVKFEETANAYILNMSLADNNRDIEEEDVGILTEKGRLIIDLSIDYWPLFWHSAFPYKTKLESHLMGISFFIPLPDDADGNVVTKKLNYEGFGMSRLTVEIKKKESAKGHKAGVEWGKNE